MFHKASLLLVTLILAFLPLISGCGANTGQTVIPPQAPITVELRLSEPPKLGQTTEITLTAVLHARYGAYMTEESLAQSHVWLEFYWTDINGSYSAAKRKSQVAPEELLQSGSATWEGALTKENPVELRCSVRFPKEGIWEIKGLVEGKDWPDPDFWQIDDIELAVTSAAGGIMKNSTYGPELSYLDYFPYGRVGEQVLDEEHPLILVLDVPKSPRAGEEIPVTCTLRSLVDKPDFSVEFGFRRACWPQRSFAVPPEIVLISGDLIWQGDIQTGSVVQFSINVRFPEAGDWSVGAGGQSPGDNTWKYSDGIGFHISKERGSFGWSFSDRNCPDYTTPRPSPLKSPLTRPE